jgi:hypothetical protein
VVRFIELLQKADEDAPAAEPARRSVLGHALRAGAARPVGVSPP